MKYIDRGGEIEITDVSDFDLRKVFECGQCFRWNIETCSENDEYQQTYTGVAFGRAVRLRSEGGSNGSSGSVFITCTPAEFETVWYDYFDLGRDYADIRKKLSIDAYMQKATDFGAGIRILQQESWEALCSFIISQCNNIPRIKKVIAALCREFGDKIEFMGKVCHTFPSADKLASKSLKNLEPLHAGYRAEYILGAARAVAEGAIDLDALKRGRIEDARAALKKLRGVGDKVADCAVLFGLNMLDAFPRDVWILRAVAAHFGPGFDHGVFSPYAGVAQQYMYYYARGGVIRSRQTPPAVRGTSS